MRLSIVSLALAAATNVGLVAAAGKDATRENTYFNTKKVPPLLELTPKNFAQEIKDATWILVKNYSPYCPHCIDYAPTFQTLYEYYSTQSPSRSDAEDDFEKTYGFKFASINCIAYFDLCVENGIKSYPTTNLYHKGEKTEGLRGVKDMKTLVELVEKSLEEEKPGSRPDIAEISPPTPGADSWPPKEEGKVDDSAASKDAADATTEKEGSTKEEPAKDDGAKEEPKKEKADTTDDEAAAPEQELEAKNVVVAPKDDNVAPATATEAPADAEDEEEGEKKAPFVMPTYAVPMIEKPEATGTPNPNGISVELNPETFQNRVTLTQDPWLVKFYAPWCHHCQALAPVWDQLGKMMQGKINIGEVNCDKENRLCKDVGVQGFPTVHFFRGGERVEYDGLRGLGDFSNFCTKAADASNGVQDVTLEDFEALEEKEEVMFVYFYDHAATTEDFLALERLPLPLIGRAKIVRTRDPRMYDRFKITTWPRLLVSREGRPTYYQPLTPKAMRDVNGVLNWMKSVWLPIVPEMTATNAREIMDGKIVVLGILNRDETDSYQRNLKEMKTAAHDWMDKMISQFQIERQELRDTKQLRIEEAEDKGDTRALRQAKHIHINMDMTDQKQVGFAWVDGVFWQRWVRTTYGIDVANGERVIINDEDNKRYWDETLSGSPIVPSRTSIMETLKKVYTSPNKIPPKLTISSFEKIFFDIKMTFVEHPWLSGASVAGFCLAALIWARGRSKRRGGYFKVEDTLGGGKGGEKGGLLGGVGVGIGNGAMQKAD